MSRGAPHGPEEFKALTRRGERTVGDLLALNEKNDPFYCGKPAQRRDGEWFAELWERFKGRGGHLRRMHYNLLGKGVTKTTDKGTSEYLNDKPSWAHLQAAAAYARHLGLVNPFEVKDQRNEPIRRYAPERQFASRPNFERDEDYWSPPAIKTPYSLSWSPTIHAPKVLGYDYEEADQPVLIEVWVEKSGVDDVLNPLCRRLGVNFSSGTGYQSITHNIEALLRAHKPMRILYISDFDPAGKNMPVATARQIEFYLDEHHPRADVLVDQIVLTQEQVDEFELPHAPGDPRVELDALEALVPGELARIVGEAILEWRDEGLRGRLTDAEREAEARLRAAWEEAIEPFKGRLDELGRQATEIEERYSEPIAQLAADLAAEVEPLELEFDEIIEEVRDAERDLDVDLPERPEGEVPDVDTSEWLFDTSRDYLEQLAFYKRHKKKSG